MQSDLLVQLLCKGENKVMDCKESVKESVLTQ